MIKRLFLWMIMILVLAFGASAAGNLTIIPDVDDITANVSSSAAGNFTLNNTRGEDILNITFNSTDINSSRYNISSDKVSFSSILYPSLVLYPSLDNITNPVINYTIALAGTNALAGNYTGTITASSADGDHSASFGFNLTVNPSPNVTISSPQLSIIQNMSGLININVTNYGNVDETSIVFNASDLAGTNAVISSANINFSKTASINWSTTPQTDTVAVTVSIPEDAAPGTYTSNISASYRGGNASGTLTVIVAAQSKNVSVTSEPSLTWVRRNGTTPKTASMTIKNTGNVNLTDVSFNITTPLSTISKNLTASITVPPAINLTAGESKNVSFSISDIPVNQSFGTYTGTVLVSYAGINTTGTLSVSVEEPVIGLAISNSTFPRTGLNRTAIMYFTLSNTGNVDLTDVTLINKSIAGKYNLSFSESSLGNITAGTSKSITLTAFVPEGEESGVHNIGQIKARSTEYNKSFDIYFDTEGRLTITEVEVKIDSSSWVGVDNKETISRDAKPGSEVEFRVTVKNGFESSTRIEETEITVIIEGIDDEDDMEETSPYFKVSASGSKTKTKTLSFILPVRLEDDASYTVKIQAEGTDNSDASDTHSDEWTIELNIDKKSHDLRITKADLAEETVACSLDTTLSIKVVNAGENDEEEAVLAVVSSDLGISESHSFEIDSGYDEDAEYSRSIGIDLSEKNLDPGTYEIKIDTYYDNDRSQDTKYAKLTVAECTMKPVETPAEQSTEPSVVVLSQGEAQEISAVPSTSVTEVKDVEFKDTGAYIALLVLINLVVIGSVASLAVKYLR